MAARNKKAQVFRRRFGEDDLPDEPVLDRATDPADIRLIRALNYYNLVDIKDKKDVLRKWVLEFARGRDFTDEELRGISRMEDWRVTNNMGAIARLLARGTVLTPATVQGNVDRIRAAARRWLEVEAERQQAKADSGPAKDPAWEAFMAAKGDLEDMWDTFYYGTHEGFSAYAYLTERNVPRAAVTRVRESFARTLADFKDLQAGDKDMKEAFPKLKRPLINRIVAQAESIVADCDRYVANARKLVVRKPRKRKEKSAAEQVKGVAYLKAFPDLQLVSVDPSFVVGARQLWLYSTRYKTLRHLVGESLSVKGSTVHGWDPGRSQARTLRKPAEVLAQVLGGTSISAARVIAGLKTKPMPVNGRINGETIIVRALK